MRKQWLRRFEEDGESPPQIANADGYDVRTVRKQIEATCQEREAREARSLVLRQALEKHYADLVAFAEKLDKTLISPSQIPFAERRDRMWSALREHLPRSPIWKDLDRWEHLHNEISRLKEETERRLWAKVESKGSFKFAEQPSGVGLNPQGLSAAVTHRLEAIVQRDDKSFPLFDFEIEPVSEELAQIRYGAWGCAIVPPEQKEEIKKFIADLMNEVSQWPECESMRRALAELKKVREALSEELATVILRRVVPGRCKYCPI